MIRWVLHSAEDKGSNISLIVCSTARGWAPKIKGESHPVNEWLATEARHSNEDIGGGMAYLDVPGITRRILATSRSRMIACSSGVGSIGGGAR